MDAYSHCHRTSGTHGQPLLILDTADDWSWWIDTWQYVLDVADIVPADRSLMAFSYGPFIGFWTAHDAALAHGSLVIPGGGLRLGLQVEVRTVPLGSLPRFEGKGQRFVDQR
ncbi:MAG: hypothetical protein NTY19_13080 [Planctomycetota bacterium]|nr:hypothetical protein [Planctomycetota bacterium]